MKNCPYIKKVLVTGVSSGIGKATALMFADNGFTVFGISRSCAEETVQCRNGGSITYIRADVNDEYAVERAVSRIDDLGIVIHCAGFGISGSAECTSVEAAKAQMETNYFGVLNVNSRVMPVLRQQPHSLIMFTSSFAGIVPIPFQSHYSSSKYALEAYAEALGMEAKPYGVKVCIVEPGDTKTGFTNARTLNEPVDSVYYEKCTKAVAKMAKDEQNGKSPETVAEIFFKQAHKKNPATRVVVGFSYKFLNVLVKVLPVRVRDFILALMY